MTLFVPLSALKFGGDIDSRAGVNRGIDIEQLANSIAHLGLILPLSVIADGEEYRVVDGNRRLAALKIVHEGKEDANVPVLVQDADIATAREMSLAANIERLPLHPVDQYEAFVAIANEGKTVADIAATFGLSERTVQQRLALGRLIPEIRQAYRNDHLRPDDLKPLANLDQAEQQKLWDSGLSGWQLVQAARNAGGEGISPRQSIAKFVGREAYVEAGGTFIKDLFVAEEDQMWADAALVETLAKAKADAIGQTYLDAGWSFFERSEGYVYGTYRFEDGEGGYDTDHLSEDELADWTALQAMADGEEEMDEEQFDRLEDYDVARGFSDEQKAKLGVVLTHNYEIMLGAKKLKEVVETDYDGDDDGEASPPAQPLEEPLFTSSQTAELDCHLTHAVQACIASDPAFAKKVLLAHLISQEAMPYGGNLSVRYDQYRGNLNEPYRYGREQIDKLLKKIKYAETKTTTERIKALSKLDDKTLDQILAYFVAQSVVTCRKGHALVDHLYGLKDSPLKPLDHWQPTAENFFGKLTKKQLQRISDEEGLQLDVGPMKRQAAAERIREKLPADWLPAQMRP